MNQELTSPSIHVTLGICVKNAQLTIRKSVESVLEQNYPHQFIELIIVDGQSWDKTLEIINDCLENTNIRLKTFVEGQGLGYARNVVVSNAGGDFIIWVDGDMILSRNFVRQQLEFMEQNPHAGIAKGRYGIFSDEDKQTLVASLENLEFLINTNSEGETMSKSLGTSGCIYRVKALRQAGGFDPQISGVGEDMDAENRIRKAGWTLHISSALFCEIRRQSWSSLWQEYFWHGKGGRQILKKDRTLFQLYKMLPPILFTIELLRVPKAYKITGRKIVFLLPLQYVFKRTAWLLGFIDNAFSPNSHMKKHEL